MVMQKISTKFLAAVFLFRITALVDVFFVKFLVAGFFEEQFCNDSGQIVDVSEVAKEENNCASVKTVDTAHSTYLVQPVIPVEFSVKLKVIYSHIEVNQVSALFIGKVILGCLLDSCARVDISFV
jgi:hypothetical protein